MPGGDRTGPLGHGPMTGRRAGFCAGYQVPGNENPRYGFGRRLGRGIGRGVGRGYLGRGRRLWWGYPYPDPNYNPTIYPQTISKEEEKTYLEETIKNLEEEIKSIRKRIGEISKEKE
jgi:hypothetical protein